MRIIISPAKNMREDSDSLAIQALPQFLPETGTLLNALRSMTDGQLQALWKCNDAIAKRNIGRLRAMDLHKGLTPAILSYVGIQYQYMAPNVFEGRQYDYLQERLRILSGFYGLLRPFDGVTPYRLEMQAKLAVGGCADLYGFWGAKLADTLSGETDLVVNLASAEYSRAVKPYLPPAVRFLTCTFGERKGGKVVEKGTLCKMARGEMVRWLAENAVSAPEDMKEFCGLGYRFAAEDSTENNLVFIK